MALIGSESGLRTSCSPSSAGAGRQRRRAYLGGKVKVGCVGDVLGEREARDGGLRAVDQVRVGEEVLEDRRDAADSVQV